ncbi:MAG: M16 family metallopeptidase [Candidatus Micrarchaeaceae archaeon]
MGNMGRYSTKTADNGLKIVASSFLQLETVSIAFGVKYGSIDEKPAINGAAHFLEHMLFKGTKNRTWKEINDQLKELGVYYNAFTDHETTVYFMQVYKGYFDKTMGILSDMIKNSTIPEKEFELERGPIINENLIRHDNSRYMVSDYMPQALYRKHPARMTVGGDNEKTIMNVERSDLLNIYDNYYTPRNSVLSIYGGISAQKAIDAATKHFGDFEGDYKKPVRFPSREKQEKKTLTLRRKGIQQTRLGIGFKCSEFRKDIVDEFVSLLVMERYLDDRLFEEIREKRGLSYDPMAAYSPYSTFGFIAAAAGIKPNQMEQTKSIMLKEFGKLQDGEIDMPDFNRTKRSLYVDGKVKRESTAHMSINTAIFELMYGGAGLFESLPGLIKKASLDDVRKYAGKYIDIGKYGMVMLKPS